jgi:hypothetical protein
VAISGGGTGQTTATAAFDALNPMTTGGDIIYESAPGTAARLPIGSTGQVLTVAGGLPSWAAAAGGQLQAQLFTAPGTWTKPSSCSAVKVTVVGGGGGGSFNSNGGTGGTSSFGSAVSATGGTAGNTGNQPATMPNGTGSVSSGTSFYTGASLIATQFALGLAGTVQLSPTASKSTGGTGSLPWSIGAGTVAGAGGFAGSNSTGGNGGAAVAYNVPVSGPVAVTVGGPGAAGGGNNSGYGGVIVVEFVG